MFRDDHNYHSQCAKWYGENPLLRGDQREEWLRALQVGDCIRCAAGGCEFEDVKHNAILLPQRHAHEGRDIFFRS